MGSPLIFPVLERGKEVPLQEPVIYRAMFVGSGEPVAYPQDIHQSRPTLPKIILSPERDSSFLHLVLPPIRDAGLREESLGSASALSSHLVLPSTDILSGGPMPKRDDSVGLPREPFPSTSVVETLGGPSHPGPRPHLLLESAGSPTHLRESRFSHHLPSHQVHDPRQDTSPFAFSEYANSSRQRLQMSDMGSATLPSQTHAGSGGEHSMVRNFGSSELSTRGYESVSAPPTAMQDGSPGNMPFPRRETFHPPSRPTHDFSQKKRSMTDTRYPNAHPPAQYHRPSTSYDIQRLRHSDYAYRPADMHSYHPAVAQSPHLSAPSYSPVFMTEGSSTFDGLPYQRDSRHGPGLSGPPSEHSHDQGIVVDLERRCEEIATNCLEILQDLEGTEDSRQQRKRRMVRASHEIVDQLQDLAYHGTWPTQPPGPTYGAHLAQAPGMHNPGSDFPLSSSLDVVARLERTNPVAAAEAARDMAAIRARTHGTFPDAPVEENRKER